MSNENYLIASYFVVGALVFSGALAVYYGLKGSFDAVTQATGEKRLAATLRRSFPLLVFLPALLGFFSVSFRSCAKSEYTAIIADRAYLLSKNREQLATSWLYLAVALLFWAFSGVALIHLGKRKKAAAPSSPKKERF